MLILLTTVLTACGDGDGRPPPPTGTTPTVDSGGTSDAGWTLGTVQACDEPLDEVSWSDRSDLLAPDDRQEGPDDLGWLLLEPQGDTWQVFATGPLGVVTERSLGGSATELFDLGGPGGGTRLADLDGDGAQDLLLIGEDLTVHWSDGSSTLLDPFARADIYNDAVIEDLNGDGVRDVVAIYRGMTETQGGPVVWLGDGDRGFQTPIEANTTYDSWGSPFDMGVVRWDDDAMPDLYVCMDGPAGEPNRALCNAGDGTFTACDDRGAAVSTFCMGMSRGDVDGDGTMDLFIGSSGEVILLLDSAAGFIDSTYSALRVLFDDKQMVWGTAVEDIDNDGDADLLAANGDFSDGDGLWPLWLYTQDDGWFTEVGESLGLPQETGGRALLLRDLNADGVLDVLMADKAEPTLLLLSDGCTAAGWLQVAAPRGSWVRVEAGDKSWLGLATDDPGFAAAGPAIAHIGLGEESVVDRVVLDVPWVGEVVLEGPLDARQRVSWER